MWERQPVVSCCSNFRVSQPGSCFDRQRKKGKLETENSRLQFRGISAGNHCQDKQIRNCLRTGCVLLQGLLQRGLGLFCPAEMQLGNRLRDQRHDRRGGRGLRELFEHVECLLVLFSTLFIIRIMY